MNFVYETDRLILKICGEEIAEDVLVFDLHNTKEFEAVEPIDVDNFYNIEHHRNILNYEYKKMLPENAPSIAILENLGFKKEGLLRDKIMIQDRWRDHYLYGLLASEFVK